MRCGLRLRRSSALLPVCMRRTLTPKFKVVDALIKWPEAAEPNHTVCIYLGRNDTNDLTFLQGFSLANDTEATFYAEIAKSPDRARRFAGAMSFFTTGEEYSLNHLTNAYDWGSIGTGIVVELGGSHGGASFALARKYPALHLIVQDLPEVVANCEEEADLNVKFMAHSFFDEQPVRHADVYLLRWILHNWPENHCIKILRALIPALKQGSKIVIMDFVMPPFGESPNSLERKLR